MATKETAIREELVRACKVIFKMGIESTVGHMSARLDENHMVIKPRPVSWFHLTANDLIVLDLSGKRVDGPVDERATVHEWPLHAEVYKARPDVNSVLHAHPVDSSLMAALGIELEPLTRDITFFADGVPVHDDLEVVLYHRDLYDTPELGAKVAHRLGSHHAVLLRHHGNVVVGGSIAAAGLTAYTLERAAQIMLKAASIRSQPILSQDKKDALEAAFTVSPALKQRPAFNPFISAERWAMLEGYYLNPDTG